MHTQVHRFYYLHYRYLSQKLQDFAEFFLLYLLLSGLGFLKENFRKIYRKSRHSGNQKYNIDAIYQNIFLFIEVIRLLLVISETTVFKRLYFNFLIFLPNNYSNFSLVYNTYCLENTNSDMLKLN